MPDFLIRLLIAALVIFIVQVVLGLLALREPAGRILMAITIVVCVLFILFGATLV